jgi:SAM-dependent methyltransferase
MKVGFSHYNAFPGWDKAPAFFSALIERESSTSVLEIGAGANPTLTPADVSAMAVTYTTNDVLESELAKAGPGYETLCLDIANADPAGLPEATFDFVFSRMVNEHIADGERYYRNIFDLLLPGGTTAHCFSTLYALPFVVNRFAPERLASRILDLVSPRDRYRQDKFRAYYSWSRGPSRRSIARLRSVGFEVCEYRGYFGHPYYISRLRALGALEERKATWLVRHPIAALTSYAVVVLRKPLDERQRLH